MFYAAVAKPRWNEEGECTFDGKLGIFPLTQQKPAKNNSKNRAAGTMVTTNTKNHKKGYQGYQDQPFNPSY